MNLIDKIEEKEAIKGLARSGKEFLPLFESTNFSVEIYRPNQVDKQTPHDRDEFYLIISGEGKFKLLDEVTTFKKGDFLYVPAHTKHRFF